MLACSRVVMFGTLPYCQGDLLSPARVLHWCRLREAEVETGLHRRPHFLAGAYDLSAEAPKRKA
jgi:hypothetical protein